MHGYKVTKATVQSPELLVALVWKLIVSRAKKNKESQKESR